MLLNILLLKIQLPPPTKNDAAQRVSSAEIEKLLELILFKPIYSSVQKSFQLLLLQLSFLPQGGAWANASLSGTPDNSEPRLPNYSSVTLFYQKPCTVK